MALRLLCIQQPCLLLRWQPEESLWPNSTWKTRRPPCASSVFHLLSHDETHASSSLTYVTFMAQTNIHFCVSGSTSMAPVGPRCRPRWHAMRRNKVKNDENESWTSASHRTDCRIVEDFIGTNTKNNGFNIMRTQQ